MPERFDEHESAVWNCPLDAHPALTDVRSWVRQRLDTVVTANSLEDILLVVIELVTNADLHTASPEMLVISCGYDAVRVEVTDGDPEPPVLLPPSATRSGGRGIALVDAVSARWGIRQCGRGKTVWSVVHFAGPAH
ncbi:hypothetical protein ALI144C_00425 [Actinosynnema sp. ALI-1.44]|uniref:ATP-binding protein n=1 Tax=Actinosynnema sp. ALI-1.44 TaxID=1933779 RepID=UPI00097C6296|nr:ATP-binding protein [Actinosynnema sp. ALI-1.44]ONI91900.1 hypothetical protein ALI144C_00425 [Actinosynnema sp. ALI-1.44]